MQPYRQDLPLAARLRTVRILWGALSSSTLAIAGVYFYLRGTGGIHVRQPPNPSMYYGIAVVAAAVAAVSFVLPRSILRGAAPRLRERTSGRPVEEQLAAILPVFQTAFILGMALSESISLFGLVLGMLGFDPMACAPFFVAGSLFALVRYPSDGAIMGVVEG